MSSFPKGYCDHCQIREIAREVKELSGLILEVKPAEDDAKQYVAMACYPSDEEFRSPVFHNYAPTKLQAAKDLVGAVRVSTFE